MTTALVCGGTRLAEAARALGLAEPESLPDIVLLELSEPGAVKRASALSAEIPRVVVVDPARRELVRALGVATGAIVESCEPAAIGPLVAALVPAPPGRATRAVLCTAARGGVGRTLLVANLARRLAARLSVFALDITATGALAWWLGAEARPWCDLQGLAHELSGEHLALVASDVGKDLRAFGAAPLAPIPELAVAATRAALDLADVVLIDAPPLSDPCTQALRTVADRTMVLSYADPASLAALCAAEIPEDAWLLASQAGVHAIPGRAVLRALPRDDREVAAALSTRGAVAGALGRAYDALAELLALDVSA
ncbi:MAG: hypothetical protein M3O91_03680 [Chloroflexota bacterium]|nr:hypothetical protein [Chloroflexota bacterium]